LPPLILRFSYSAVGFVLAASISLRPGFRFVREDWLRTVLVLPTSERAVDFGSRCAPADFPEQPPPVPARSWIHARFSVPSWFYSFWSSDLSRTPSHFPAAGFQSLGLPRSPARLAQRQPLSSLGFRDEQRTYRFQSPRLEFGFRSAPVRSWFFPLVSKEHDQIFPR
jgi:hypothetical protein